MDIPLPGCRSSHAGLHTEGMHLGALVPEGGASVELKASKGVVHPSPRRTGPQGPVQARGVAPKGWCIQTCREPALRGWCKQGGLHPKGGASKLIGSWHLGAGTGMVSCTQRVVHPSTQRTGIQGPEQTKLVAPKGWCIQARREPALGGYGRLHPKGGASERVGSWHPGGGASKVGCTQRGGAAKCVENVPALRGRRKQGRLHPKVVHPST